MFDFKQSSGNYGFYWNCNLEFVDFDIWKISFRNLKNFLATLFFELTPLIPFEEWRLFYCLSFSEWLTFYPLNEMPTKSCSLSCSFKVQKKKGRGNTKPIFGKKNRKKTLSSLACYNFLIDQNFYQKGKFVLLLLGIVEVQLWCMLSGKNVGNWQVWHENHTIPP